MPSVRELFERWGLDTSSDLPVEAPGHRCFDCTHPAVFDLLEVDPSSFTLHCSLPMPEASYAARSAAMTLAAVESAAASRDVSDLLWVVPWCSRRPFDVDVTGADLTARVERYVRDALSARRSEVLGYVSGLYPGAPSGGPQVYLLLTLYDSFWFDGRLLSVLYDEVALYPEVSGLPFRALYRVPSALLYLLEARAADVEVLSEAGIDPDDALPPLLFSDGEAVVGVAPAFPGEEPLWPTAAALVEDLGVERAFETARALGVRGA